MQIKKRFHILAIFSRFWPTVRRDGTRTDETSKTRPVQPINVEEEENDSDRESQS